MGGMGSCEARLPPKDRPRAAGTGCRLRSQLHCEPADDRGQSPPAPPPAFCALPHSVRRLSVASKAPGGPDYMILAQFPYLGNFPYL